MKEAEKKELMKVNEELQRDWNKRVFAHIRKLKAISHPSPNDSDSVKRACETYFDICEADGMKPSVSGLASALGTNRETLMKWLRGEISIQTADVIMEYFSMIEIFDETALKDNKTNAVAGLFNMKNNYGYRDEVEHRIIDDKKPSNAEIEQMYRDKHGIIDAQPHEIDYTEGDKNGR